MDITINNHTYRTGKIDARAQFHIVRRLAPIFGELVPALRSGKDANPMDVLPAITASFAKLSDEDMDYCLFGLLRAVTRQQPNGLGWGPVCTGTVLAYDDISMAVMLQLAWASLKDNLSGFFAALPSDLREALPQANGPSAG